MKIAGRCFCGFSMELVAKRPDEHMRCFGLRWCGRCREAARFGADCRPCANRRSLRSRRVRGLTEATRLSQRLAARRWAEKQRRHDTPHYQRDKAIKRQKYAARVAA